MTSLPTYPRAKTNYLFKIILQYTASHNKLMIPKKFVMKHGKDLADRVCLKAPFGALWQVELERTNGEVWLCNGWLDFAAYYSICFGHLLVFQYEGNSIFQVIIFDKSASEVEYPISDAHTEQANLDGGFDEGKEKEMNDQTVTWEKSTPFCCPQMEKLLVPPSGLPEAKKLLVSNSQSYTEANHSGGCWEQSLHGSAHASSTKRQKNMRTSDRMKPIKVEEDLDSYGSVQEIKGKLHGSQMVTEADEARVLGLAKAFKSDNPFYLVVVRLSYISRSYTILSKDFVLKFKTTKKVEKDNVVLQVTDRRTWPVKCALYSTSAMLLGGWGAFARENHLVVGDVCIFELIDRTKKLLNVVIFRAKEHAVKDSKGTTSVM